MRKIIILIVLIILGLYSYSQDAKVKNVKLEFKLNKVLINYDLIGLDSINKHNIELFFVDDHFTVWAPDAITGDYGTNIEPGLNKQIEWDLFKDNVGIAQKLKPIVVSDGIKKGGSKNAYLSILIPGLGDYFVKDSKEIIIKPYIRTVSSLGLIGLGIIAGQNRIKKDIEGWFIRDYNEYNEYGRWVRTYSVQEWDVVGYEYDYWLFNQDKEIFLIAGATIWILDVVWVFMRGLENEKLKMFSNYSFNSGVEQNGFTSIRLTYSF